MTQKQKVLPALLETIKIEDGLICNLSYHQKRCDNSRKELYGLDEQLLLKDTINPPPKGCYRCRVVYASCIQSIEYIPYIPKKITSFKIVPASFDYHLKYANRDAFNRLLTTHSEVDDIIIEQEGYLTDTTIANIAFFDGHTWYTPAKPLLSGTMRQKLLDEGAIQTKEIRKEDLHTYSQVALINAMLGFKILKRYTIEQ